MTEFLIKCRGNSDHTGKPKVFFTCHPDDFDLYFEKITNQILSICDCSIYYCKNLDGIDEDYYLHLGKMQLFVFPVTKKLLTTDSLSISTDLDYALKNGKTVLPLMQDVGQEKNFEKVFGNKHFLSEYTPYPSTVSYSKKLTVFLLSTLVNDELEKKVRAEFDAYIFFSYRKKDRKYVDGLMRAIHKTEQFRDVAIWYDEFLNPDENFEERLKQIILKSDVFLLLQTPNVLENPNYVKDSEIPFAEELEKDILAVELSKVNQDEWKKTFKNGSKFIETDLDGLAETLAFALKNKVLRSVDNDLHNFLIGVAYLYGIDLEVDFEKAIHLIENSAKNGCLLAIQKMVEIYLYGVGADKNTDKSIEWQKFYTEKLLEEANGKPNEEDLLLTYLEQELFLAELFRSANLLKDARNSCWRVLKKCKLDGRYGAMFSESRAPYFARAYVILGDVFKDREDYPQARECYEKGLNETQRLLKFENSSTSLLDLTGKAYLKLGLLYLIPGNTVLISRIESCFLKGLDAFKKLCDIECTEENLKFVVSCYNALCVLYLTYFGLTKKEAVIKANQSALDTLDNIQSWNLGSQRSIEYYEALMIRGDIAITYDDGKKTVNNYLKTLELLEQIPPDSRTVQIKDCICRCHIKIAEIYRNNGKRADCVISCSNALGFIDKLYRETKRDRYRFLKAKVYVILSYFESMYGEDAFNILVDLHTKTLAYDEEFFRIRRDLWKRKVLNENNFKKEKLTFEREQYGDLIFTNDKRKQFRISFYFVKVKPTKKIVAIEICNLTLVENNFQRTNSNAIQLTLGKINCPASRDNPTPDEFVTVYFEDGASERYQRCYG